MTQWLKQRERGSGFLIRLIAWIALTLGRPAGRFLLYPICGYFISCSPTARRASRHYLGRVLGRRARLIDAFRHYHCFAATILDRVFFLTGRFGGYDITVHDADLLRPGCILLGAHLGSFEVMRSLAINKRQLPLKVLMHTGNSQRLNAVIDALNPEIARSVLPLGRTDTMLRVKEWLDEGGMIGILGDRITHGDKLMPVPFLGGTAHLPAGPLLLAGVLKAPVVLFFGIYRGGRRYDIHFELLAETITLSRGARHDDLAPWLARYAARLEHYCREAPYNWFNFYNFWSDADAR